MPTVFVTGGSRGIGAAVVQKFYVNGYDTAFCYNSSHGAAQSLLQMLPKVSAFCCDLADPVSVGRMCEGVLSLLGRIDVLVLNAGRALPQQLITDTTLEQWDSLFDVNLRSMFLCTKALLPSMIAQKSGSIVTVSSMWGETGASCEVAYSASKAGVIGFTKALAREAGPSGIRVNCVSPGVIATDMNSHLSPADLAALREQTPLCAVGSPQQAADVIYMLAASGASFVTGQVLGVNGGFVM